MTIHHQINSDTSCLTGAPLRALPYERTDAYRRPHRGGPSGKMRKEKRKSSFSTPFPLFARMHARMHARHHPLFRSPPNTTPSPSLHHLRKRTPPPTPWTARWAACTCRGKTWPGSRSRKPRVSSGPGGRRPRRRRRVGGVGWEVEGRTQGRRRVGRSEWFVVSFGAGGRV